MEMQVFFNHFLNYFIIYGTKIGYLMVVLVFPCFMIRLVYQLICQLIVHKRLIQLQMKIEEFKLLNEIKTKKTKKELFKDEHRS
jgi:hypothetical protein